MRKGLVAALVGLAVSMLVPLRPSAADGTEMLGVPSIPIATGTDVVSDGTGLMNGPGQVTLNVPAGAVVKQVLAYWECLHEDQSGAGVGADNTLVIGGTEVVGTNIGQRYFFGPVYSASFRADITALNKVTPGGVNNLAISGLDCNFENDGASIVVIYDDGGPAQDIQVRDGNDTAYRDFTAPVDTTTPVTFTVPAGAFDRVVDLTLLVGGVDINRPNAVRITVGGNTTTLVNPLNSSDGAQWDDRTFPVNVPAGVTSVTVQVLSQSDDTNNQPASLQWVGAILSASGGSTPDPCGPVSGTAQITHGNAYGVDAALLNIKLVDKLGNVSSVAPGSPNNDSKVLLQANVLNLVTAKVNPTQSNSALNPPRTTASATVADLSLLGGLVKATTIRGVSQSVASTTSASYNSNGSTIQGLLVNNNIVNVKPNTTVAVKGPLGITVAELKIYSESGSSSFANGVSKASHSVDMLKLKVLSPILGITPGTTVTIAHAQSDATGPTAGCPSAKSVSGEAFTVYADGRLAGLDIVDAKQGQAVLPPTGGSDSDGVVANLPGIATSGTATNTTSGSLVPNPHATSRSRVEGANVLGGLVTATLLDVSSTSNATGASATTTYGATFVNLKVAGVTVDANVAPNSTIVINLGPVGYVVVTLNERITNSNGTTDTAGTINAVHARVYALGGLFLGEVIVASAHSDAHV